MASYTTMSLDALKFLCSVINGVVDLPTSVISDTSIATNTTHSSYKIGLDMDNMEHDIKSYVDTAIVGLNKLTKEIINDKALVVKDNVLYLYKADGDTSNNYMQMMLINGVAVELGSTQADFSNIYNKTEIDDKFAVKLDLDTLTASFNDLKDDFSTHIGDTTIHITQDEKDSLNTHIGDNTIHITQAEKDSYALKSEVITNDSVAHIKRFSSVPDNDWNNAIEEGYYSIPFDSVANNIANRPYDYAIQVHVIRADTNDPNFVYQIAYVCASDCKIYVREQKIDGNWTPWRIFVTTSIANVGKTTITPVNSNITGTIKYTVKNGTCYVSMKDLMSTISSTNLLISTTMPKPSINCTASSATAGGNIAMIYIDKNTTNLRGDFYTKNAKSDCSFSYPVAEN